jgi:Tfp pilus assembly protein PilN
MGLSSLFSSPRLRVKAVQVLYADLEGGRHFQWLRSRGGGAAWRGFPSYEGLVEEAAVADVEATFLAVPRSLLRCAKLSLPIDAGDSLAEAVFYRVEKTLLVPREEACYSFFLAKETPQGMEGLLVGMEKGRTDALLTPLKEREIPLAGLFVASFGFSHLLSERAPHHVLVLSAGRGRETLLAEGGRVQDSIYLPEDAFKSLSRVVETKVAACPGPRFFIEGLDGRQEAPSGEGEVLSPASLDPTPLVEALLSSKDRAGGALGFNMLPLRERKLQRAVRRHLVGPLVKTALAVALAAFVLSPLVHYEVANGKAKAALARLKPLAKKTKKLEKRDRHYQALLGKVAPFLPAKAKVDVMRELVNLMPNGTILNVVRMTPGTLRIEGYTPSASQALQSLERSPFFHNATFVVPVTKERGRFEGLERFGIEADTE